MEHSAVNLSLTHTHPAGLLTRQRKLVFEILKETPDHPDAGKIFQEAKKRDERISLATVYRSLDYFKKAGLVAEDSFGEDHGHFEAVQKPDHYHFTCLGCGEVVELDGSKTNYLLRSLGEVQGLQIAEIHIHLQGYCTTCQKAARVSGARK